MMKRRNLQASAITGERKSWRDPDFKVSPLSAWRDRRWSFPASSPGASRPQISWEFELRDGSFSTDPCNETLLESFKEVWFGMLTKESWWGSPLKPASSVQFGVGMRELFTWMAFKGYKNLSQLTSAVQVQYLNDLPLLLTNRSSFYEFDFSGGVTDFLSLDSMPIPEAVGGDGTPIDRGGEEEDEELNEDEGEDEDEEEGAFETSASTQVLAESQKKKGYSYHQASLRVLVIYYIFAQKPALIERGLPHMASEAFDGAASSEVCGKLAKYVVNRIPPLPDEIAIPLLREAFTWVDGKGQDVVRLQKSYIDCEEEAKNLAPDSLVAAKANKMIENFSFSTLGGGSEPWRAPISEIEVWRPQYGATVTLGLRQVVRELVLRTRDAALVILQYLVGLRVSELCSLLVGVGPTSDGNFPSCVTVRLNQAGTLELFFLHGIISKGVETPRPGQWLIACRPAGSDFLPLTVRAIKLVEELFKPWREKSGLSQLFLSFTQPKSLPKSGATISPINVAAVSKAVKRFIYAEVDLSSLPDVNERGEELWRYRDSKGRCIRTYQGRKTYAAYVLESRTALLPSLQQHFKHLSDAMTESAYFPAIYRLRQDAESQRAAESIEFFSQALEGRPLFGAMAKPIEEWLESSGLRNVSKAEREKALSRMVLLHDLRIFFGAPGNCFIRLNPLASRCQKIKDNNSWAAVSPDESVRTPSLCAGCGCFAWNSDHLPFWMARAHQLQEEKPSSLGSSRVIWARLEQAKQIVRKTQRGEYVDE